MAEYSEHLKKWIKDMAALLSRSESPDPQHYTYFLQEPDLALHLIDIISQLNESEIEEERTYYSACVFALDICVAQLQSAHEQNNKLASKILQQLMAYMAKVMIEGHHSLSFWLPLLNAFYEVHVELSDELKNAYFTLANEEDAPESDAEEISHLNSIRDLIEELSDLSVFEIAENFFAQSYAMPADFFADLLIDLYSIEEGQEIALLLLLHPKPDVREVVVATFEYLIENVTLSPIGLTRLRTIKKWYPQIYHARFEHWIKIQRKKGVYFETNEKKIRLQLKATEVDGSGAQGIFIHLNPPRKNRLGGMLLKQNLGIKDVWITPYIAVQDVKRYYHEAFNETITLRKVDLDYLKQMTNHFLAVTIEQGGIPDLHLLELQEELGMHFSPQKLDMAAIINDLAVSITPFTPEILESSLTRSKGWPKNKKFTESWYIENAEIDKLVNRNCTYIEGVKVCKFEEAMKAVFENEMELNREQWVFHFLWMALWLKNQARQNEKTWQDCFFIAYTIFQGTSLKSIPIMNEICYQTVVNSIETMQERRTYLAKG